MKPVGRATIRKSFGDSIRLTLVEDDLDEMDSDMAKLRNEVHDSIVELRKDLAATRQVLTGILVALVVASIMLAINLAVVRGGS